MFVLYIKRLGSQQSRSFLFSGPKGGIWGVTCSEIHIVLWWGDLCKSVWEKLLKLVLTQPSFIIYLKPYWSLSVVPFKKFLYFVKIFSNNFQNDTNFQIFGWKQKLNHFLISFPWLSLRICKHLKYSCYNQTNIFFTM